MGVIIQFENYYLLYPKNHNACPFLCMGVLVYVANVIATSVHYL
jgi:hypothetical protein